MRDKNLNLDTIMWILEKGINEIIDGDAPPIEKLQYIENLTGSFIAIVNDFRFIHALKKEKD